MSLRTEELKAPGYERVVFGENRAAGLSAIIAVHHTGRGPSCGGIRLLPYASRDEALKDVLRLAKGMSYKSALAGIGFGGGKSVIVAQPAQKTTALFHAMGEFIEKLDGTYIAAKDMNITSDDLIQVQERTKHVLGITGVKGSSGDPSPMTAHGLFRALEATALHVTGKRSLSGLRVAIQGLGHVGYSYAELIREAGAELWVTDLNDAVVQKAKEKLRATPVAMDAIYDVKCDIFSPCAVGSVLNSETIPRLHCRAVCGGANNQLATEADGLRLHERGIWYAPDYAVNSGGIINIYIEYAHRGYDEAKARLKTDEIYLTIKEIFRRAQTQRVPPSVVADELAVERLGVK